MQAEVKDTIEDCAKGSGEGRLTFAELVMKLMGAGVERYHADLCRAGKTSYVPDGKSLVVASAAIHSTLAQAFSAAAVEAAIRAIQAQTIKYAEFCEPIAAAGCVGYIVSLAGRRAVSLCEARR